MDTTLETLVLDSMLNSFVPDIPASTRFWMIRTKKGFFYNDFIINNYVALGWNLIDSKTNFGNQSLDILKKELVATYRDNRPTASINKCFRFINEINEGDILIIPSSKMQLITFAKAGKYFEDAAKTIDDELDIVNKIENSELKVKNLNCPYKKRRKITILKTVKSNDINFNLYKGISNYHGISNFDDYAKFILDSIYNIYTFKDICSLQIGINTTTPIKARDISKLLNGLTSYMCEIVDDESLSVTLNLNSPGRVSLSSN